MQTPQKDAWCASRIFLTSIALGVSRVLRRLNSWILSEQSIYTWRRQDRIDKGLVPGLTSKEKSELGAANKAHR